MFAKLVFLLAESFRALFRAKLHAVISSITIGIALVIFSLAYLTYINLLGYSYEFKSKYRIEVFFESNLDLNEARDLFNTILVIEGIEQGEFVDKEKAAKLFKSFFKEDINEIIGDNPLPMGGRFDITENYRKFDRMGAIVKQIRYLSGVDVASFQQGIISRVDTIVENILGASMLLGLVIFLIDSYTSF
jgi:Cell division protein